MLGSIVPSVVASEDTFTLFLLSIAVALLLHILWQLSKLRSLLGLEEAKKKPALPEKGQAVKFTREQRAAYAKQADTLVAEMLDFTSPSSKTLWKPTGTVDGAQAFMAQMAGSDVVCVKGVRNVTVADFDDVIRGFTESDTDEKLHNMMSEVDKQFMECRVLGLVDIEPSATGHGPPAAKSQLEWMAFKAPPVYPRDFCWLSHQRLTTADGRPLFVSICQSIELDECPELWATRRFVRGAALRAGYVFRGTADPRVWELSYVVQIDPRGMLPTFVVNLVANDQAGVAGRMCALIERGDAASAALRVGAWAALPVRHVPVGGAAGAQRLAIGELGAGQRVEWRLWAEGGVAARVAPSLLGGGEAAAPASHRVEAQTGVAEGAAAVAAPGQHAAGHALLLEPAKAGLFGGGDLIVFYQWRVVAKK